MLVNVLRFRVLKYTHMRVGLPSTQVQVAALAVATAAQAHGLLVLLHALEGDGRGDGHG